ncbi:MAG: globin [Anaerolineae bacterium]
MSENQISVYERIGGDQTIRQLVDIFYAKVEADATLRTIFPEDLEPGKRWQYLFLVQYWGGPQTYAAERGHPRLRMRHSPYPITTDLRDRWVQYMHEAIDEVGIEDPMRTIMREYFERAGSVMINRYQAE